MADLIEQLTPRDPVLRWIVGVVTGISSDNTIELTYEDQVVDVVYLKSYTPLIGDTVHGISQESRGVLVLGTATATAADPALPTPSATQTFSASSSATWGPAAGQWEIGVLKQDPGKKALWFYPPFTTLSELGFASLEVEVTKVSGGPPVYILHKETAPTASTPALADVRVHAPEDTTVIGVPTWVELPLEWAELLATGQAAGVGMASDLDSAVFSGTGRLRFTFL